MKNSFNLFSSFVLLFLLCQLGKGNALFIDNLSGSINPPPPVVTHDTICIGQSATLTASSAIGSILWYDAPSGGNLLHQGDTLNTGPLNSSTTYYAQVVDSHSYALQFLPNSSDQVDCGNPTGLFDLTGDGTIEAWVINSPGEILGKDEGPGTLPKWFFGVNGTTIRFHINGPGYGGGYWATASFTPPVDEWYHVAVTKTGNKYNFYFNGSWVGIDSIPQPIVVSTAPLTIGYGEPCCQGTGVIDEIRFYNLARSEAQISASMNACADTNGLIAYYPMNDGPGNSTVADYSQYGNDGVLVNMDTTTSWVDGHTLPCYSDSILFSTRVPVTAHVLSNPDPTITAPTYSICDSQQIILDAGLFTTYEWNTGADSQSILISNPGNYSVTVTDTNGCTGVDSVDILIDPNCGIPSSCLTDTVGNIAVLGEMDTFSIYLNNGDSLRAQMNFFFSTRHERIDLYHPNGTLLKSVITADDELAVLNYSINFSGQYILVLSEAEGDDTDTYGLSVTITNNPICATPISCLTDTTASIDLLAEMDAYTIDLNTGDSLRVQMNFFFSTRHERIDLYHPNGTLLKSVITADDELAVLNYSINFSGQYILVLSEAEGDDTDTYGLSVTITNNPTCATPISCLTDTTASIDLLAEMDAYTIDLNTGDSLRVQMNFFFSTRHERIDLYHPNGTLLKSVITADDELAVLNYSINFSGQFILVLSEAEGDDTDTYGLSVTITNNPTCATPISCLTDTTASIDLLAEMDAYTIDLNTGDSLRVQMNFFFSTRHERIDLYHPNGTLLKSVITADDELAVLNYSINFSGQFILVLSEAEGDDTDTYGLSVTITNNPTCATPISCLTDTTASIDLLAEMDAYTIDLNTGDSLRVQMNFFFSTRHERIDLYHPNGTLLKSVITADDELAVLNYSINFSGQFILVLSEAEGDDTDTYGLSVTITNNPTCATIAYCTTDSSDSIDLLAEMDAFSIYLTNGDSLSIHMDFFFSTRHERIDFYHPNGTLLNTVITGDSELAVLNYTIGFSGYYIFILSEAEGDDTGDYDFSINGNLSCNAPCVHTLIIDSSPAASQVFEASHTITTSGTIQISNGLIVKFQGGNQILLNQEFEVELGGEFEAVISDCGL